MTKIEHLVLAGGGTAGHVNPLLSVADRFRSEFPDLKITVFGTAQGLEADLVPRHGYELTEIPKTSLPRSLNADALSFPRRLREATATAKRVLATMHPARSVVIGFGGYVSTPVYRAAKAVGIPVVVHEGNALSGLANKYGARFAKVVAVTFPQTKLPRAVHTGLPLLGKIAQLSKLDAQARAEFRVRAAAELGIDPELRTLVVTGGSQGALSINTAVAPAAEQILAAGGQVIHVTGMGKFEAVANTVQQSYSPQLAKHYHVHEYSHDMAGLYGVADLVLGRAGAGSVCELTALGIAGVFVPYPVGNGEQRHNCAQVVSAGGGLLVTDKELTSEWVARHVTNLLFDDVRLSAMQKASRKVGIVDADRRIMDLSLAALGES